METGGLLILLRLLTAHVIGDFVAQPKNWVASRFDQKGKSPALYYHSLLTGILTWLFLGDWSHWQLPLFIMVTHYLIDLWKTYQKDNLQNFVIDQISHLIVLIFGWILYMALWDPLMTWCYQMAGSVLFWATLLGFILVIGPFGIIVEKFTAKWRKKLAIAGKTGLPDAGKWIGKMERLLVLSFVLLGQYQAIGFLIAAKSIFRFNGITENKDRMEAEYIMVGTFMSFALAILLGLILKYLLKI